MILQRLFSKLLILAESGGVGRFGECRLLTDWLSIRYSAFSIPERQARLNAHLGFS